MRMSIVATLLLSASALAQRAPTKERLRTIARGAEQRNQASDDAARATAKTERRAWKQTVRALNRAVADRTLRRALRATEGAVVLGTRHQGPITDFRVERLVLTADGLRIDSGRKWLSSETDKWDYRDKWEVWRQGVNRPQPVRTGFALFNRARPVVKPTEWGHVTPRAVQQAIEKWADRPLTERSPTGFVLRAHRRAARAAARAQASSHGRLVHEFERGHTMDSVAQRYGVTVEDLKRARQEGSSIIIPLR